MLDYPKYEYESYDKADTVLGLIALCLVAGGGAVVGCITGALGAVIVMTWRTAQ
jgi:hypothetical protein